MQISYKVTEINSKIFKMATLETNDYGSGGCLQKFVRNSIYIWM